MANEVFRFGDLIENGWAGSDNPTRYGYFVRRYYRGSAIMIELTDGADGFWHIRLGPDNKLKRIANAPPLPLRPQLERPSP